MMSRLVIALVVLITCIFMLAGCGRIGPGPIEPDIIGPRTQQAWEEWGERQEALRQTWGDTEIYAYVQTIMEDLEHVNAGVVFKEGFSTETPSTELDALQKLYDDANLGEEITIEEFLDRLMGSPLRYAVGTMLDLDGIEELSGDDGAGYDVTLLYYPNADSLMPVSLTVGVREDGTFTLEKTFLRRGES